MTSNTRKISFSSFKLKTSSSSSSSNNVTCFNELKKKKHKSEEDYFNSDDEFNHNDDDDNDKNKCVYLPAIGSPGQQEQQLKENELNDDEEEDELDLFMKNIEKNARKDLETIGVKHQEEDKQQQQQQQLRKQLKITKGIRDDIEKEDMQEEFYRWLEENPNKGTSIELNERIMNDDDDQVDIDYDSDGNLILNRDLLRLNKKEIDPLPCIDHALIDYKPFEKNFYQEHEDISELTDEQVKELRQKLNIRVSGISIPKPVCSFGHLSKSFDSKLISCICKQNYTQPTPIQSQSIPCILNGRDVISIAKTGSGKTVSFIWPALIHIMDQHELNTNDGPIVLILTPTRELSQQIYTEARKYAKLYNIKCVCTYGGGSLYEQTLECKQGGCELLVSTPGRLIDLIKKKATNLERVTYLVLDEADRMLDMGFETQVRSIVAHCRPNRQLLLFSATFKYKIERLARELLNDPIRIIQGELGEANINIKQIIHIFDDTSSCVITTTTTTTSSDISTNNTSSCSIIANSKWQWLLNNLIKFKSYGKVLIFVTRKQNAIELFNNLIQNDNAPQEFGLLHGDMTQYDRNIIIKRFKLNNNNNNNINNESDTNELNQESIKVLIATDVASRGLDIMNIKTVINYDVAKDIDTHVHRIGRTGRANETGHAYTLINKLKDKEFVPHLVRHLESSNEYVPQELIDLAYKVPWFNSTRFRQTTNKKMNTHLSFKKRPGLGSSDNDTTCNTNKSEMTTKIKSSLSNQNMKLDVLKQAFKNSFKNNFTPATNNSFSSSSSVAIPSNCFNSNTINQNKFKKDNNNNSNNNENNKAKRSRWDN